VVKVELLKDPVIAALVTVLGNFLLKIFSSWWDKRPNKRRRRWE